MHVLGVIRRILSRDAPVEDAPPQGTKVVSGVFVPGTAHVGGAEPTG